MDLIGVNHSLSFLQKDQEHLLLPQLFNPVSSHSKVGHKIAITLLLANSKTSQNLLPHNSHLVLFFGQVIAHLQICTKLVDGNPVIRLD